MSYLPIARKYARRYFGPKGQALFLAQMGQESGFRGGQTSSAGAQGPAQLMPGTAKAWGVKNPNDPEEAYAAAAKHMKQYLDAYGGSWDKALIAYNAGPGYVGQALPKETVDYIHTIRANAGKYASGTGPRTGGGSSRSGSTTTTTTEPTFDQAGFEEAQRRTTLGAMVAKRNPNSFLIRSGLLSLTPPSPADFQGQRTVRKTTNVPESQGGGAGHDGYNGSGIKELFWNGPGARNLKNGTPEPQGFVSGHTDHVHVAAGPRTVRHFGRVAQQRYGLHVGENPAFGGVNPVHVQNSYHYRDEAIDVSGDPAKMRAFANYVYRYGTKGKPRKR